MTGPTPLYPTPTRLRLLAQIANGQVLTDITRDDGWAVVLFPDAPTSWQDPVTVSARVREMEAAGWTAEEDETATWRLTDAGRAVLGVSR